MDQTDGDLAGGSSHFPIMLLPPELQMMVLERVWNRDSSELETLSRCSLVCSRWRPTAQTLLFTDVHLPNEETALLFLSAVSSNPSLGQATRILNLTGLSYAIYQHHWETASGAKSYITEKITALCPKLYQLTLEVPFDIYGRQYEKLLHPHTFETLQALHLVGEDTTQMTKELVTSTHILHFLSKFSSLSHLRLQDLGGLDTSPSTQLGLPPPPKYELYEFSWKNRNWPISSVDAFEYITTWLLGGTSSSLRIFDLRDVFDERSDTLSSFINKHGEHLTSFTTWCNEGLKHLNLSEICPDLRELLVPFFTPSSEFMSTVPVAHLEHLGFQQLEESPENEATVDEVIRWSTSMPNIQLITLYEHSIQLDPESYLWQKWEAGCGKKIQLETMSKLYEGDGEDFVQYPGGFDDLV